MAGVASAAVTTLISLVLGYDRLAEGTVGGTVTTMLFVAALLLVTSGVILGVRVRTPPHGITPWRRVGKAGLIVWLGVAALWGAGILIGRVFPVTGPGVVLIVVLLSLLALPLVLWLPVWTLLSALRSPGRVEPMLRPSRPLRRLSPDTPTWRMLPRRTSRRRSPISRPRSGRLEGSDLARNTPSL